MPPLEISLKRFTVETVTHNTVSDWCLRNRETFLVFKLYLCFLRLTFLLFFI